MSFDREQIRIALALFVVALLAALMLAVVNNLTKEPIAEAKRQAMLSSLTQVLPTHSNDPVADGFTYQLSKMDTIQMYPAKNEKGEVIAYAWEQVAPDGYAGSIRVLMGVDVQGKIVAIRITDHKETPGLGDGITKDMNWLDSFVQKSITGTKWAVKKDGGDFDQFTGATITPRAVVNAVQKGLQMFSENSSSILKTLAIIEVKRMQAQDAGGQK